MLYIFYFVLYIESRPSQTTSPLVAFQQSHSARTSTTTVSTTTTTTTSTPLPQHCTSRSCLYYSHREIPRTYYCVTQAPVFVQRITPGKYVTFILGLVIGIQSTGHCYKITLYRSHILYYVITQHVCIEYLCPSSYLPTLVHNLTYIRVKTKVVRTVAAGFFIYLHVTSTIITLYRTL